MKGNFTTIHHQELQNRLFYYSRGYWRVKSINILNKKYEKENDPSINNMIKRITRVNSLSPSFLKIKKCNRKIPKLHFNNNHVQGNFFLITQKPQNTPIENNKVLNILFKDFPYEKDIYKDINFISALTKKQFTPRKFDEVIRDSKRLNNFSELLKSRSNKSIKQLDNNNENPKSMKNIYLYKSHSGRSTSFQHLQPLKIHLLLSHKN